MPDIDICSSCGEHCEFDDTEEGYLSNCCGTGPYDPDYEYEIEYEPKGE